MKKNDATVSDNLPTVSKYSEISRDVWNFFKKNLPTDADLHEAAADLHELNIKYEDHRDEFIFMNKLLKVYFDELNRLKGVNV